MNDEEKSYGLIAIGRHGAFTIDVDEVLSDPDDWRMTITSRDWSFRFRLKEHGSLFMISGFLTQEQGKTEYSEMEAGTFLQAPVVLVKDSEFPDCFFLRTSGEGHLLEFTLVGDGPPSLAQAAAQVAAELE